MRRARKKHVIFMIARDDIQMSSSDTIGRVLTDEELQRIGQIIEYNFRHCAQWLQELIQHEFGEVSVS